MVKKLFLNSVVLLSIAAVFSSCTIPLKVVRTGPENPASVPPGFDPEQNVLLVAAIPQVENSALTDMKSTIKLEKELQKHYPYPYKIVWQKDENELAKQFGDTMRYRFALLTERRVVKQKGSFQLDVEEGLAFVPGYKATYIDFVFYDRLTGQRFPQSGTSTSVMKIAVNHLTARLKKAGEQKMADKLKSSSARNTAHSNAELSFRN